MGKIDEVLRAYLCQFTFINTLSALPSLGFYLRLITLYLLMPCRNTLFSPLVKRGWIQRRAHFSCSLLEHWHLCLSKMQLEKISKPFPQGCCCRWGFMPSPTRHQAMLLETSLTLIPGIYWDQTFKSTTFPKHKIPRRRVLERELRDNLLLKGRHMITSAFVLVTCPCKTEKSFEHTPRRAGNLSSGSLVKWPSLKNILQKEWSPAAKESGVFFHPWIGFRTSSQSESLYILAICHFQSIRPYALLTIILNYTY